VSRITRRLVREQLDSAVDNSFNGVYDHDRECEWLASRLNKSIEDVEEAIPDPDDDPEMFQKSIKRFPERG
jgi:hypothetical protein